MATKIILAGNIPEGWEGTNQELLELFARLLRIEGDDSVAGGVTTGPTAPTSHSDVWIDTSDPKFTRIKVYNEGYARWLPAYDMPIGSIIMAAPTGVHVSTVDGKPDWLVCDGAVYQASDYPELFDFMTNLAAGSEPSWGPLIASGGATSFCVPDLRGRVPVGVGLGVDYASLKKNNIERQMGSKGTLVDGDDGLIPQTNHPGYVGHEFTRYEARSQSGAVTRPKQEMVSFSSPQALIEPSNVPSLGQSITAVMPPATVLQFLIKAF